MIAGYDAWKTATPPEYEQEETRCRCKEGESCEWCMYATPEDVEAYERHMESKKEEPDVAF